MAAGHLFLLTLLLYTFQYIKAQGELKKPEIGVSEESYHKITIVCVLPESVRDGSSCNLYTGDQPQPYKEAQAIRMMWKSTIRILCSFNVIKNDLFRRLQERRDVSCDYGENTGSQTLSPRIDGYNFTFHKPVISTSRYEEDRIITCLIPGPAGNVTTCNLYAGEQNKPFLKTHIGKKKSQKANRWYCTFSVTEDDLIRRLWSVRSNEVSCDYRVSSGPNSLSPRSDGYSFTDLLISDPTTVTAGLTSPLTPSTAVNPTSGSPASSTLTTDTAKISTEGGQSSTESDVISNSQESVPGSTVASTLTPHISVRPTTSLTSPMTPSTAVNPTSGKSSTGSILTNFSGQAWQVAVGVVSGVGVFLVGLITCYLCRRTKKNHSQRPTVRQEDHSQYDLVMGAMSSAGKVDSGDSGIYSLITSVPSTFLPSCPVQVSAHEDEDSGNARIYSLITVPSTFIPSGPIEENGQSFENYTTDTYHVYSSIPDRLATSAQPDGLYSLLQAH